MLHNYVILNNGFIISRMKTAFSAKGKDAAGVFFKVDGSGNSIALDSVAVAEEMRPGGTYIAGVYTPPVNKHYLAWNWARGLWFVNDLSGFQGLTWTKAIEKNMDEKLSTANWATLIADYDIANP